MKEKMCRSCKTINTIEFTLRTGNTSPVTIRCKSCKKLMQIEAEAPSLVGEIE